LVVVVPVTIGSKIADGLIYFLSCSARYFSSDPEPRGHAAPPELPCARRTGAGAQATRGDPRAALSWDVGTRAAGIRGAPGAALRREAGGGAQTTCGGPGAVPSQSHRDTRRPRSCPELGGGCQSSGDTRRPWSCLEPVYYWLFLVIFS
jgi:hypothetical protein